MRRLLTPREHGTYAQLTFPLLSGLLLGGATWPAVGLVVAVVSVYLAYEPVAVLLGARGVRLQREAAEGARRQLAALAPIALLVGLVALVAAPPAARLLALLPVGMSLLLVPLVLARRIKTIAGETLVAGAMAGMHLPVAAAGGAAGLVLWGPAAIWFSGFFLATLAVHGIKARQKRRSALMVTAAWLLPVIGLLAALALALLVPELRMFGIVLAVPLLAVLAVALARVHPRALKRVGWTLVAADAATLALLTLL